eukprot:COSAG05_NODE_1081_length_5940_cov_4.264852_7_plen_111_part_00
MCYVCLCVCVCVCLAQVLKLRGIDGPLEESFADCCMPMMPSETAPWHSAQAGEDGGLARVSTAPAALMTPPAAAAGGGAVRLHLLTTLIRSLGRDFKRLKVRSTCPHPIA